MFNVAYSRNLRRWRVTMRLESTTTVFTNSKSVLTSFVRDLLSDPDNRRRVELSTCGVEDCPFEYVGPIDLLAHIMDNIYKITIHELENPS